jgi:hypothetical protein
MRTIVRLMRHERSAEIDGDRAENLWSDEIVVL